MPSLQTSKLDNIGKIRLEAKYNWSDTRGIERLHEERQYQPTKIKISKPFIDKTPKYTELERQSKRRQELMDSYCGHVDTDVEDEEDKQMNCDESESDDNDLSYI